METQSTSATTEATLPTGDIKVFIDAFNKDFDDLIKKSTDNQNNLKNIYADAIKISTPRTGTWPKDENVKTIGDLFKYTFPDITTTTFIQPPSGVTSDGVNTSTDSEKIEDKKLWNKDFKSTPIIKEFFDKIKSGVTFANKTLSGYQDLKKPGITNPSLWSPGQYYFDIFMLKILDDNGPLKSPGDNNGGDALNYKQGRDFLKLNGGSASVGNFEPSGSQERSLLGSTSSNTPFDYFQFNDILSGGYSYDGIKNIMVYNTGIDIGGFDLRYQIGYIEISAPISFPSLRVQYTSGLFSELKKDTKFNYRGEITDTSGEQVSPFKSKSMDITGFNFTGAYEHILLYKAFIQAGDNYKSIVLPYRIPTPEPKPEPVVTSTKVEPPTSTGEVQFKFNVEIKDTFIVVGGTVSPPLELIIVPNDGTKYIFEEDEFDDSELGDEYKETDFEGLFESPYMSPELEEIMEKETSSVVNSNVKEEDTIGSNDVKSGGAITQGGDADFWSLIAVCSLEDSDDQARADIAQSIYNRVGSGAYGKENTIKTIITATWQYEPTFIKGSKGIVAQEWKNINSKETAIKAIIYSKKVDTNWAIKEITRCFNAIKNPALQKESQKFVQGRTDFLSENQGLPGPRNVKNPKGLAIIRSNGRPNNVFAWNYNYRANKLYNVPTSDWFNKYNDQFASIS